MVNKTLKKIRIIVSFGVLAAVLAGCGTGGKKNDVLEDMENLGADDAEGKGLKEQLGIDEDHVSYQIENTGLKVDADITVPDAEYAGIYDMQPHELTSEEMKKTADSLFDNGQYTVWYPPEVYEQEERDKLYDEYSEYIGTFVPFEDASYIMVSRYLDLDRVCNNTEYKNEYVQNNLDGEFVFYDIGDGYSNIINEGGVYWSAEREHWSYVYAEGTVDGKTFRLTFVQGKNADNKLNDINKMVITAERRFFDYYNDELADNELNHNMYGTPGMLYTDEEIETQIKNYLKKFELDDFVIEDKYLLQAYNTQIETSKQIENTAVGYCYILTREQNKIPAHYMYGEAGQEIIRLYVTVEGIVMCEVMNRYEISSEKVKETTLMKYEEIDKIFQNQVVKDYEDRGRNYDWNCNHIEFMYKLTNVDNQMVLIPVWVYSEVDEYMTKEDIMVINAVDGTVIEDRTNGEIG